MKFILKTIIVYLLRLYRKGKKVQKLNIIKNIQIYIQQFPFLLRLCIVDYLNFSLSWNPRFLYKHMYRGTRFFTKQTQSLLHKISTKLFSRL